MIHLCKPASFLLAALASTASLAAQYIPPSVMTWPFTDPPNSPPSAFQQVICGDFSGALRKDMLIRRNGTLYLGKDPSHYQYVTDFGGSGLTGVTGMVTFPRRASGGLAPGFLAQQDVVLAATNSGAYLGILDVSTNQFAWTLLNLSGWSGAKGLVARMDGSIVRVGAISADGTKYLLAQRTSTGNIVTPPTNQNTLGPTIYQLQIMDWDHNGSLDVVATTSSGIRVSPWNSTTQLDWQPATYDTVVTTPVTHEGVEKLAVVSPDLLYPSLAVGLFSYQSTPIVFSMTSNGLTPGQQTPVSIAAGDADGDGVQELLVGITGSFKPILVWLPTSSHPTPATLAATLDNSLVNDATHHSNLNLCPLLWQDLDWDGHPDVFVVMDSPLCTLFRSCVIDCNDQPPTPQPPPTEAISNSPPPYYYVYPSPQPRHCILTMVKSVASTANLLDITIWHQSNPYVLNPDLSVSIDENGDPRVLSSPPLIDFISYKSITIPSGSTFPLDVDLSASSTDFWPNYDQVYFDIRYIEQSTQKVLFEVTAGMALMPAAASTFHYNTNLKQPSISASDSTLLDILEVGPPIGTVPIGGLMVRVRIPKQS